MKSNIYFNWLDDSRMLVILPSQEVAEKVYKDWCDLATSDDSDASYSSMRRRGECEV